MKNIIDYLESLDLYEMSAKMYLKLLETGSISVRELAKKVGVNRTGSYEYINQLIEKGLIIKIVKGSRNQVAISQPKESLEQLVEQKIAKNKIIQQKLPDIIKTILEATPQSKPNDEAEIKHYTGRLGVKKIYKEALKAKELRSYVNIEEVLKVFPENAELFDDTLNHNPEMKMFEIVEDSPQARERITRSKKRGRYFYKILPGDMKIQSTDILIYDGKVSFINLKNQINGVVLHNTDLFYNFKLLFDFLWKMLP